MNNIDHVVHSVTMESRYERTILLDETIVNNKRLIMNCKKLKLVTQQFLVLIILGQKGKGVA
jgi:hypothetical protein